MAFQKYIKACCILTLGLTVLAGCSKNPADSSDSTPVYRGEIQGMVKDAWITVDDVDTYSDDQSYLRMTVSYKDYNPGDYILFNPDAPSTGYSYLRLAYIFDIEIIGDTWKLKSVDYPLSLSEFSGSGKVSRERITGAIDITDLSCYADTVELHCTISASKKNLSSSEWPHGKFPKWFNEQHRFRPDSIILKDIASNGVTTVCVGNVVISSESGGPWKTCLEIPWGELDRVVWTGNEFLAVGLSDYLLMSKDGTEWQNVCSIDNNVLDDVYGDSDVCIVRGYKKGSFGGLGGDFLASSKDWVNWSRLGLGQTWDGDGGWPALGSIVSSGSLYLATYYGYPEGSRVAISEDGDTWTTHKSPWITNILWDGRRFVGLSGERIRVSQNGMDWDTLPTPPFKSAHLDIALAWSGTTYVIGNKFYDTVTNRVGDYRVFTSTDAINWEEGQAFSRILSNLEWHHDKFLAVNKDMIYSSYDGHTWAEERIGGE